MLKLFLGGWFALVSAVACAAPAIQVFQTDSMARIIAGQKGKPFVLMVWSLDCEYCQASLNTLAQEKRKRKDLTVVTLATDALGDAQVKKKLGSIGLGTNAWAFSAAPQEQLRYAIDAKWHGEMPRSYWFNAKGERVGYSGLITAEIITKFQPE